MVGVKKSISTAIVALAVASVVHADMMPLSPGGGEFRQPPFICGLAPTRQPSDSQGLARFRGTVDGDLLSVGFLPDVNQQAADVAPAKPPEILTDRQNSLILCLYALLGLGLCRSAPLVKRLSFSCIPDWYHSGSPTQIGHSFVISPDCLNAAPIFCFIQPAPTAVAQDLLPQHRWRVVVSLWRQRQFTSTALVSRGPPSMS